MRCLRAFLSNNAQFRLNAAEGILDYNGSIGRDNMEPSEILQQRGDAMTSTYLTSSTRLFGYMAFPRFLLDSGLSETAMLVYALLLDRARLSMTNPQWIDEEGHVFLRYPIRELAAALHRSEMTVKTALAALEQQGLILRQHLGIGIPNRIYVLLPEERNLSAPGKENCPPWGQKTVSAEDRKLSGNKTNRVKQYNKFTRDYDCEEFESL